MFLFARIDSKGNVLAVETSLVVKMKEGNIIAPYVFIRVCINCNYFTIDQVIGLLTLLFLPIDTKPTINLQIFIHFQKKSQYLFSFNFVPLASIINQLQQVC